MIHVTNQRIVVETRTLIATWERGTLVSLSRKSDGKTLLSTSANAVAPMTLLYSGSESVPLGMEPEDTLLCRRHNDHCAEIRVHGWYGDGVIRLSEDETTGDMIVEPSGYASRPGLRACRWTMAGLDRNFRLVAPFFQGIRLPLEDAFIHKSLWRWPHQWEAGLAILEDPNGCLAVHCEDTRYRYKALMVGSEGDPSRLGFDTEAYGPIDTHLAAGGLAWRVNVYEGDWQKPAERYRSWLKNAYALEHEPRPDWIHDVRLAISWCPTDTRILAALRALLPPERVLIHLPNWRTDPYDENYPTYEPSPEGRAFVETARHAGFRVMPHFNSVDMDPTHPVYALVRDFQYRSLESKRVEGWTWVEGNVKPVPESNATRLKHRNKKTMVKIHPGLSMWRSILAENVQRAVETLSLEVVFLDVTLCSWNLYNGLVEDTTSTEGMKRLIQEVQQINGGLVVGGEGRNEITALHEGFAQVHLFRSWHRSTEAFERLVETGLCPLNEFLFGEWCRSFGYSGLSGRTPEEAVRMRAHVRLGAIPTLTIGSAEALTQPNDAIREMLRLATSS